MGFDPFIEIRIFDKSHFDSFGNAGTPISITKGSEESGIINYVVRRSRDTHVVLIANRIDAVLYTYGRIVLGQDRRRSSNLADTPIGYRAGKAGHIDHCATTYRHDI